MATSKDLKRKNNDSNNSCIICLSETHESISLASPLAMETLMECANKRLAFSDTANRDAINRIIETSGHANYHRTCYRDFTRIQNFEQMTPSGDFPRDLQLNNGIDQKKA